MNKLEVVLLKVELKAKQEVLLNIRKKFKYRSSHTACDYVVKEMEKVNLEIEKLNEHIKNNP